MSSKVCVNCHNKKPVNLTDNRLVTESCGHVKCMECLIREKSGCLACFSETDQQELEDSPQGYPPTDSSESEVMAVNNERAADLPVDSEGAHINGVNSDEVNTNGSLDSDGVIMNGVLDSDEVNINGVLDSGEVNINGALDSDEVNMNGQEVHEGTNGNAHPVTSHIKIETDEKGHKTYVCICKKRFHRSRQVKYHAYCNGQRKPYQCTDCSKSFAVQSHYQYHMRVHRDERTYACESCGDTFFQMSKLQRHRLKHTKEKNFVCKECSKAFDNLTALRKHGVTHTAERPYRCDACGLRYRDPSNLRKHVVKHATKSMCNICGRGSAEGAESAGGAAGAARCMHQERRAYQCPRCPQSFHNKKDMRRHAQVHTDSKPYRCKVCNRRFRRKDNLERHIRNTHPDFVPASAVECDEAALRQIATNGRASPPAAGRDTQKVYETNEKIKLEILNPLPPLPEDVIQKHIHTEQPTESKDETPPIDKSYILEANNSRQSVIVAKCDRKVSSPVAEYVHKIRRANSMSGQKDNLPPIDEEKFMELDEKTNLNNLDIGVPHPNNIPIIKKILYPQLHLEKETNARSEEDAKVQSCVHWRRKKLEEMKLNINWYFQIINELKADMGGLRI